MCNGIYSDLLVHDMGSNLIRSVAGALTPVVVHSATVASEYYGGGPEFGRRRRKSTAGALSGVENAAAVGPA